MTNTREEVAVAEAIKECEAGGDYDIRAVAQVAIAASNSKYVAVLVEALKAAQKKAELYLVGDVDDKEVCRIKTIVENALNSLPPELRQ